MKVSKAVASRGRDLGSRALTLKLREELVLFSLGLRDGLAELVGDALLLDLDSQAEMLQLLRELFFLVHHLGDEHLLLLETALHLLLLTLAVRHLLLQPVRDVLLLLLEAVFDLNFLREDL
jgi:hypothetical protein